MIKSHINVLLRRFFSKVTSFDDIIDEKLQTIVNLINNYPIKKLSFRTPFEGLKNSFLNFLSLGLTIYHEDIFILWKYKVIEYE